MKTLFAIALLFTVVGCGRRQYSVDPRIEPVVQKFRDLSKQYGHQQAVDSITISVLPHGQVDGSERVSGYCDGGGNIQIDENVFYEDPHVLELVVFHELGHCVLGRGHSSQQLDTGMPASIMYPDISDYPQGYEAHPETYWKELFQ